MKSKILISILVISAFIFQRYSQYFFAYLIMGREKWNALDDNLAFSIKLLTGIVLAVCCSWAIAKKPSLTLLGLRGNFLKGIGWAFIFTLPMFIGYYFIGHVDQGYNLKTAYHDMILAGFAEEFLFRGMLFGLLFYCAGWGFIPACLITGIFFGAGHLYQAENFSEATMIFLFTALASAGFAWFYYAWNSLWMVIFLHGFMDMAWELFSTESNVTGSLMVNVFRFSTLIFAIVFSVMLAKKEGRYDLKSKLWTNGN